MANNKRQQGLDQPAGNTLTGIDRLLAELASTTLAEGEFTIAMVQERSPGLTGGTVRCRLDRLVQSGVCAKRKVIFGKRETNIYRYV
jgi:hypothetical protein